MNSKKVRVITAASSLTIFTMALATLGAKRSEDDRTTRTKGSSSNEELFAAEELQIDRAPHGGKRTGFADSEKASVIIAHLERLTYPAKKENLQIVLRREIAEALNYEEPYQSLMLSALSHSYAKQFCSNSQDISGVAEHIKLFGEIAAEHATDSNHILFTRLVDTIPSSIIITDEQFMQIYGLLSTGTAKAEDSKINHTIAGALLGRKIADSNFSSLDLATAELDPDIRNASDNRIMLQITETARSYSPDIDDGEVQALAYLLGPKSGTEFDEFLLSKVISATADYSTEKVCETIASSPPSAKRDLAILEIIKRIEQSETDLAEQWIACISSKAMEDTARAAFQKTENEGFSDDTAGPAVGRDPYAGPSH